MVSHRLCSTIAGLCLFAAIAAVHLGCASSNPAGQSGDSSSETTDCSDRDDCVQPPLRRAELPEYLRRHQERILSRDDYMDRLPPPVSEIIYGPLPDGQLRDAPPITDANDRPYDGDLNWHTIEFDEVATDDADHDSLRGRDVSGAHCFFARKPNRHTPIFALLVLHHRDRGDVLYLGGPRHPVTRVDTVPLTDHHPSRLRLGDDRMRCTFRDDQNQQGAIVVPLEYTDVDEPSNGPYYAVFTVTVSNERHSTGEKTTVPRKTGTRGDRVVDHEVPVERHPRPRIEFVGSFATEYRALEAAEDQIHPGDFRLRPEFVFSKMPYLSYLDTGREEFCPVNTECETPSLYLDKDIVPPLDAADE